jgi:long-chain fatty acid transport protein
MHLTRSILAPAGYPPEKLTWLTTAIAQSDTNQGETMRTLLGKHVALILICLLAVAESAFGAGFGIYEWSARGNALGGTLIGRADDPSTIAYNPAGITQLPGVQVMGGFTVLMPRADVDVSVLTGVQAGKSDSTHTKSLGMDGLAPNAYMTYQLNDKFWFGLGAYSRFGLASEYDSNWIGRYTEYYAGVVTYSVNPTIAYKINDQWSIAAGIEAMYFDVEIKRKLATKAKLGADSDLKMAGDCWAPGYNLAVHYKPASWFAAGLTYRGEVHPHVKGDADFSGPILADPTRADQDMRGYLDLPASWALGLAFFPTDRLSVEVDAIYTMWSSYKKITFDYDILGENSEAKDWKDVWRFQVGVEYAYNDWLDLRCGYVFDESPINDAHYDYMVPMTDRHIFSVGTGMHWGDYTVDMSYGYLYSPSKSATLPANAAGEIHDASFKNGHCHMLGLNFGYTF